ncbi:MAG: hypothetical protein H5T69_00565 [Chloroflexi bacterium]|nr:hypothetical protein [Chloroflexota bacterium]
MPQKSRTLRSHKWPRFLRGPDQQLLEALYVPALSCAVRYDRCCAYFSSHVLAVAARGFGGLIENLLRLGEEAPAPAVRLLVNEQLDPQDVDALLASGDGSLLAEKLLRKLKTPQAALERNRLAMLAWLVARGWLEVRVGVMRRGRGIVHAKFGLIEDREGNRIAFSGSDNETGQALVENYEEVVVASGWEDAEFVEHYRQRFADLWDDRDPYVYTLPLPEAVRHKLLTFAPQEPPAEMVFDRTVAATAMLWHFIAAAPYLPHGELACDATAPVALWPHQRHVVEDCTRAFPAGRLLCDEVGMGKTIEAIFVLRRLMAGRGVRRALLLVPAGLLKQWQEELREKGGLLVPYWDRGHLVHPDGRTEKSEAAEALGRCAVVLLSREWARLPGHRETVLSAPPWDLVLLDEAHAARRSAPVEREFNSANLLLQLLRELQLYRRARGILLLSATPMQTQPWEPWDLLTTLGVGGRWMVDFADIRTFYGGIAALKAGRSLSLPTAQTIGRLVAADSEFPPAPPDVDSSTPQSIANSLSFGLTGELRQQRAEWLRRGAPLGRQMHRNTRETLRQYHRMGLLGRPPARRQVKDVVFDYQDRAERDCYEAITGYIDRRYDELEREKGGKGFVMTIYRRRAASSPHALRCSLMRRMAKLERVIQRQWLEDWALPEEEQVDERDLFDADLDTRIDPAVPADPAAAEKEKREIESLLARLGALGPTDSKLACFRCVLQRLTSEGRAVLVFSEYQDTMSYLRDRLRPIYGKVLGCFSGEGGQIWDGREWKKVSKAEVAERLERGELEVLVCTDAASEGLNLQAASAVINYDLPWNPSKVEQRIGRVDRIGQQHSQVLVYNMLLQDSVDMRVYQVLRHRCGLFTHFVGRMQPVLSKARQALQHNLRQEQLDAFIAQLESEADRLDQDALVANLFVETEARQYAQEPPPATLADIEKALCRLEHMDGQVRAVRQNEPQTWRLYGLGKSMKVTFSRQTLESDVSVLPLTATAELLGLLTSKLPLTHNVPLVLAKCAQDGFCAMEARWVGADGAARPLRSAQQLAEWLDEWDGSAPPAAAILRAEQEAQEAARRRVEALVSRAKQEEEAALRRQVEAARRRLMRELGRTLRCLGRGDLNDVFRAQVRRESRADGRYHTALERLGGYPVWEPEDVADANEFERCLSDQDRRARIAGSEIDAALNDPRWMARRHLDG